ncbi:MAG TPA: DinB family protein [Cyclobacteriaceae bacterium]|nr:DinB family protein [Cyclobacteriaceae bacterium]
MNFSIDKSIEILERTPSVLSTMLLSISTDWTSKNEGEDTWSPYDVVGHLIQGELTDWIPRAEIIISDQTDKRFRPFDRFAQFENSKGKSMEELLLQFKEVREANIKKLRSLVNSDTDFQQKGIHPAFGEVTLSQLLSTWVVHDLNHINQITRVMARQYKEAVGPWVEYLGILKRS